MKKKILIPILILILTALCVWAIVPIVELGSPSDDYHWILGGTVNDNVTFRINSTITYQNATANCSLWTNVSGTWALAFTNKTAGTTSTSKTGYVFTPWHINLGVTDDLVFVWNAKCYSNSSNDSPAFASANRTIYVDQAPTINTISPATASVVASTDVSIVYNVTGDSINYNCYLFTNDTGTWQEDGSFSLDANHTRITIPRQISQGNGIVWNVKCFENGNKYPHVYGFASANKTISVDLVAPKLSFSPATGTGGSSMITSITANDSNIDTCIVVLNGTTNASNTSMVSNSAWAKTLTAKDGVYSLVATCNDSAGNSVSSSARLFELDTVIPKLSQNINYSVDGYCNAFQVQFVFNDDVNATFTYGTSSMAQTHKLADSTKKTNHTFILTFNDSYETTFYGNISFTDIGGNKNSSHEMSINSPVSLCTGWSLWSNWDNGINLSTLYSESGADYIYKWNDSSQGWVYYSSGSTTKGKSTVNEGEVVFYYESGNRTYFRDTTVANYTRNIRNGYNWFGLNYQPTMGELSYNQFRNSSGGNRTNQDKQFQFNYFSAYNNSNQNYITHIYKWSLENTTTVGQNWLDTVHVFSNFTVTVDMNTTAGYGHVTGNWS